MMSSVPHKKLARSVKWAYSLSWGEQLFTGAFTFLLAGLLGPREFGIVALAMIYLSFIRLVLKQGLGAALIQRRALSRLDLDSVFWMVTTASIIFFIVSIGFSAWWAAINDVGELRTILHVLSVTIILEGLTIVQQAVLQREMEFRSLSIRTNVSVIAGGLTGIVLALAGYGVWALVVQYLVRDTVALALLWLLSEWRPRLKFSLSAFPEIMKFSFANFLASTAVFAGANVYAVAIGLFLGPTAVGLYRLAERLMSMILAATSGSLQPVSLAQLSRCQDEPGELKRSLMVLIRMSARLGLPSLAFLMVASGGVMAAVGGEWVPASLGLSILCLIGMFRTLDIYTGPLLQAIGKPHYLAALHWCVLCVGGVAVAIAGAAVQDRDISTQIAGIALARFLADVVILAPILYVIVRKTCGMALRDLASTARNGAITGLATGVVGWTVFASGALSEMPPMLALIFSALSAGTVGLMVMYAFDIPFRRWLTLLLRNGRLIRSQQG